MNADAWPEHPYDIRLRRRDDGDGAYWFATVDELPGCMSDGDTEAEALASVRDAMHGWISAALGGRTGGPGATRRRRQTRDGPSPMRGVAPRRAALALAAATLLAVLLAAAPPAHGQEGEIEVRVAAQRLADGRTEFALQEREADGSWAARRLPRARFFPANATVGRWLASSPLTVELSSDSMSAATGNAGLEVRVAAQLLADGRMEFALQERNADESWAARRLPRARFFPATPRVGRWLASSPLTVSPTGSASVTVEITAVCNWPRAATSLHIDECRASEAAGLDPSERWFVWHYPPAKRADGTTIWDRAQYRFDGGVSGSSSELTTVFENLADGSHTVETRVLNGSAWSEWSMPYAFTIRRATAAAGASCLGYVHGGSRRHKGLGQHRAGDRRAQPRHCVLHRRFRVAHRRTRPERSYERAATQRHARRDRALWSASAPTSTSRCSLRGVVSPHSDGASRRASAGRRSCSDTAWGSTPSPPG